MGKGFCGGEERCSAVDSLRTQRKRRDEAFAGGETTRCNHRNRYRADDLRQQHKRRENSAHMSAGLETLRNDSICTGPFGSYGVLDRSNLVQDTAPGRFCNFDRFWMHIPKKAERMDSLFDADRKLGLKQGLIGCGRNEVYAELTVRARPYRVDFLSN